MTNEIIQRIETLINNTRDDKIIWKRINQINYEWTNSVTRNYQDGAERLISNTDINFSIQKTEGNYLLVGHQVRYHFNMVDSKNKETLLNLESHTEPNEELVRILERLFNEVTDQHNRKVLLYLDKLVEPL